MAKTSRWQLSFDFEEAELDRCAEHIREDLGLAGPIAYHDALWLCEVHGGLPISNIQYPISNTHIPTGETVGETIYLNTRIPEHRLGEVILHELVHRLSNGPRYEHLNPVRSAAHRREWIEALARRVAGQGVGPGR